MVVHKAKKVTKYRGGVTHGGGSRKKRRGAGSRGGRGNAGTGKRAGHKKAGRAPSLGKHGFNPRSNVTKLKAVNVNFFTTQKLDVLVQKEKVSKEGDFYIVDLYKLKIEKILGSGNIDVKLKLVNGDVSLKAEEKIKAAGGVISNNAPLAEKQQNESA
jgi:large subunit ribosomal protein L15